MSAISIKTPSILYAVCTALARAISTPLKTLEKSPSKRLPLVHVVYCGGSAHRENTASASASHRNTPPEKCRTIPVRKGEKMSAKNAPANGVKKPFIVTFDQAPKEPFKRIWKAWQYRAPKRHYRLILSPVEKWRNQPSRIVGDFTSVKNANAAAASIESPSLYNLLIFNSRAEVVVRNAGSNPVKVERATRVKRAAAKNDASANMHRPTTIEKLVGLNERVVRKGEYRSR